MADSSPPPYHPSTLKQWVKRVISFSTQYNHDSWSANQVIGQPRVYPRHGDITGAWATAICDANQFIEVEFEVPVRPTEINIYETYNPGAIVKIKARESSSVQWIVLWQVNQPTVKNQSRIFSPPLSAAVKAMKVGQLRIEIDCTAARNWCELDAIEIVGVRDGAVAPVDDTQFIDDMKILVNNKLHSDVMFKIDGKEVYGHKAILATRSPYFAKMFGKKSDENHVTLKLPDLSFDDLLAVLHFIYTSRLPDNCSVRRLTALCKTSSTFQIPELRMAAMYKLVAGLKVENAVELFLATKNDPTTDDIQSLCKTFMATHLKDMSKEKSFEALPQSDIVAVVQEATLAMCLNDTR